MEERYKRNLPTTCPSCSQIVKVTRLLCDNCGTAVEGGFSLSVLMRLDTEEQEFVLMFLKSSGSLKDMARIYGISYPTIRNRLDAVIDKVKTLEAKNNKEEDTK